MHGQNRYSDIKWNPNGFKHVWLARGLPYFYKYEFIETEYPDKKWIPLANWQIIGRLFDLDEFDYGYQNQFLWLYIVRQGLDQSMSTTADSLSRYNYEAITKAKTYLGLSHLKAYSGELPFKRAMYKYLMDGKATPEQLKKSLQFYFFRDVDWFFGDFVHTNKEHDYRIIKTDYCPTVSTATIRNTKSLAIPLFRYGL